jgi:hypothetical protein
MALKIGDAVTDDSVRDDIVRAIDLGPHSASWRLALDNGQDDHIESVAEADGKFKVIFVDRGRRLLKSVLNDYLDGGTDWREEVRLATAVARRISSKPPARAIVLVAAAFFGSPVILYLVRGAGSGGSRILPIAWIVGGPISVLLIAMIANKALQFRHAARWPSAPGRITKSDVLASHQRSPDRATPDRQCPTIEYEMKSPDGVLPLLPIEAANFPEAPEGALPLLPLEFFRHYWQ